MGQKVAMLLSNPLASDPRVRKEATFLAQKGFNVVLYAWDREAEHATCERLDGFLVKRIKVRSTYGNWLKQIIPLTRFSREVGSFCQRADIVHAHDLEMLPLGIYLGRRFDAPIVFDAHEPTYFADARRLRGLAILAGKLGERSLAPKASAVIVTSHYQLRKYSRMGIETVALVPNYPERWLSETPISSEQTDDITVGRIGAMAPDAGIEELLTAVGSLRLRFRNLKVLLAGGVFPGYVDELEEAVKRHADYCTFIPEPYKYEDLPEHYGKLDICVMPQKKTPWFRHITPVKFFEAMAFAKPVVTTDISDIARIVSGEKCGVVLEEVTPQAIVEALLPLLRDPVLRSQMGTRARNAVKEKYNWDVAASRLYDVYKELLNI